MSNCSICGEPMPPGEEMFKFHGYSGSCPKPPLPSFVSVMAIALDDAAYLRDLAAYIDPVYKRRLTEIAAKLDHAKADSASEIADLKHQVSEQALKYLSAMGQWDELEADLRQRLEVAEKALLTISELDPEKDSDEGYNEWGQAECYYKAKALAHEAIAAMKEQK